MKKESKKTAPAMLDIARQAVALATQKGAAGVRAAAHKARNVSVQWRDGKIEKVSEATTRGLRLELFVDGRYSAAQTKDLRPEALPAFVEQAVAVTRTLAEDPFRGLPDPTLYRGASPGDLDLVDPAYEKLSATERRRVAQSLEVAARSVSGADAIVSASSGFGDTLSELYLVTSNGFEGTRRATSFSTHQFVTVKDADGRRPEDGTWAAVRRLSELPTAEDLGRRATERALRRRGAQKGRSGVLPVVVENRAAGRLFATLLRPLSGFSLQQKRSCFEGKRGTPIASSKLTIVDDPFIPKGLGSRPFDDEGLAARVLPLIEAGVLKNFYLDTYYAKKLRLDPTTERTSNLSWTLGDKSEAELIAGIKDGVFVTSFIGGNSNDLTGDFSLGIQGVRIRNGQLAEPVAEMNISGNLLDTWKRLVAVGNDPYLSSSLRAPTLVFDGLQVAGT